MPWTAPQVEEIAMSAEIGAYQNDLGREARRDAGAPPRAVPADASVLGAGARAGAARAEHRPLRERDEAQ